MVTGGEMKAIVNDQTGEVTVVENSKENTAVALRDLAAMAVFEKWIDAKENYLMAKEQFEMVDKPFREAIQMLFDRYSVSSLDNDTIQISYRNGYRKKSWNNKKLEKFIYQHGGDPEDFKDESWVNGGLSIKYKE